MSTASRIAVGQELPPLHREVGLANWNRFAAVNDEFYPIHMDPDAARARGMDGAIGMGNLLWSYFHIQVREWLAGRGRIARLECQFVAPAPPGEIALRAAVTEVEHDAEPPLVRLLLVAELTGNERAVLARGSAVVELG